MEIDGKTRLIGLIGNPVEHTLSPLIHNCISRLCNYNSVYVPFQVEKQSLDKAVYGAYELNILGMNVTVPHKNLVIDYLVDIDESARKIGAVNTLVRVDELRGYKGYNTDFLGLQRQLKEDEVIIEGETVVIIGAGGAAKSVLYLCLLEGAKKIYVLNRTFDAARKLVDSFKTVFDKETEMVALQTQDYSLIPENQFVVFQSTSVGLYPNDKEVVLEDSSFYEKIKVGIDLIYNPAQTQFLKLVKQAGGKTYNALKMLLYQAVIAYELWHEVTISQSVIQEVYAALKRKVYNKNNVVLIGFMGSGKTTFGKAYAQKYDMSFLDADAYIESQQGKTISKIFEEHGEEFFRNLETQCLSLWRDSLQNTVIATGGGMPLRSENASLLKEIGTVFYLTASPETIYERVKNDTKRPLLQCDNPYNKICEMMEQRHSLYEENCDVVLDTNRNDVECIINEINYKMKQ